MHIVPIRFAQIFVILWAFTWLRPYNLETGVAWACFAILFVIQAERGWIDIIRIVACIGTLLASVILFGQGGQTFANETLARAAASITAPISGLVDLTFRWLIEIFAVVGLAVMAGLIILLLRDSFWRPTRAR